jgi:hypothetical protein
MPQIDSDSQYSQAHVGRIVGFSLGALWLLVSLLAAAAVESTEDRGMTALVESPTIVHTVGVISAN